MSARTGIRIIALWYLAALLVAPVVMVFLRAFDHGPAAFWAAITTPAALHALRLTLIATTISVVCNTVFGFAAALIIVRRPFRGRSILNALIDIPFAISPIIVGLALLLTYGGAGWFGPWLIGHGVPVIFSTTGIVIATIFVTLPFVVREVVPVLQEIGEDQEQAAATLGANAMQTFTRITLPAIRWGVTYGIVLTTARALGEYGAVAVVSGRVSGRTETMTIFIEQRYQGFDLVATYSASVVLAILALGALTAMTTLGARTHGADNGH